MALTTLNAVGHPITLRAAGLADVSGIVALLAEDELRAAVESTADEDRAGYERALRARCACTPACVVLVSAAR